MIRLFYNAESEATREALVASIKADLDAGQKALLLVPEQETVNVERRMLELLPATAQLSFEVVNFSRLANRVFRERGDLCYRTPTPAVDALFMWQAMKEAAEQLKQYGNAAKDTALCERMQQTASRCKAACISPEMLLETAERLPDGDPLRDKLYDIGLVLSIHGLRRAEKYEKSKDDLDRLTDLLTEDRQRTDTQNCPKRLFADTHIYFSSFTDFTKQELNVIDALLNGAAPTVSFTVSLAHHGITEGLHLSSALRTHEALIAKAKKAGRSIHRSCEDTSSHKNDALSYLAKNLFNMSAEPPAVSVAHKAPVSITACASPFEEATAIAIHIHRLVREGCRYRDIAVVARDANSWMGILDDALEREGIPFFISEKTDITLRPLIKLILGALRIQQRNWRTDDVIGYLKTDLCGVSQADVNLFEEYCSVWHPKGKNAYTVKEFKKNPDGYKAKISSRGQRILDGANRVRETIVPALTELFSAMDNATCVTERCRALYEFLNVLDIREKLKKQARDSLLNGDLRGAEELSRLYNVTVDALEDLSTAMGDRNFSAAEFSDALRILFAHTDIGSIPTAVDEVLIGSASMLRADRPRYVLVAGLNDGVFPSIVKDTDLLSEDDIARLKQEHEIEFPANSEKMVSDELFYLYRTFTAPRDGLVLFYSERGTDGRKLSPSIAISRVTALLGKSKLRKFSDTPKLYRIFTRNGAVEAYTELPEEHRMLLPEAALQNVGSNVNTVDKNAFVSPEVARQLFERGKFNPTHLEGFSSCPFKYYCNQILRLREEPDGSMSSAETGTFIHYVLEQAMKAVKHDRKLFSSMDAAMQGELVDRCCAEYRRELIEAGGEFTPRTEALFRRLTDLARLIVSGLFAEFSDSLFSPAFLELSLSEIGEDAAITLPDGEMIPLSGKIDRVDYWQDEDGQVYLRVTDYKTGTKSFRLEDVEKGFCLQMPLYLLALCRGKHKALCHMLGLDEGTDFLPAAISYLSSNISTEKTDSKKSRDAAMEDAVSRLERDGLILDDANVRHAMSKSGNTSILGSPRTKSKTSLSSEGFETLFTSLTGSIARIATCMRSGDAAVSPKAHGGRIPCEFCPYIAVCRSKKGKE